MLLRYGVGMGHNAHYATFARRFVVVFSITALGIAAVNIGPAIITWRDGMLGALLLAVAAGFSSQWSP